MTSLSLRVLCVFFSLESSKFDDQYPLCRLHMQL